MTNKDEMHDQIRNLVAKAGETTRAQKLAEYEAKYRRLTAGYERIILYGAGDYGRAFMGFLSSIGATAKIECYLDRAAEQKIEHCGFPVYRADDERASRDLRENALVVLTVTFGNLTLYDELKQYLRTLGYSKVWDDIYMTREIYSLLCFSRDASLTASDAEDVCLALDLLSDEHSRHVFMSVFEAHALLKFHLPTLSPAMTQYFDVDVPFRCHYRNFVDCGAYDGDSFAELMKRHQPEHYFGFEPDPDCYAKLLETLKAFPTSHGGQTVRKLATKFGDEQTGNSLRCT
jgi:hypothetical protein